jgi:hypothetical protein
MMSVVLSLCLSSVVSGAPENTLPPPLPAPILPAKPPTLAQFSESFQPIPGLHDVTVIHPVTCKPITFCFKLPDGSPKVRCGKRSLEFDYGPGCNVEIVFRLGGRVGVEYRN